MLLGIYNYSYNDIFCFVSDRDALFSLVEYVSLYLIPFFVCVLLYSTHPEIANVRQRIILAVNGIFPVIILILHFTDIVHVQFFVLPVQILTVIEALILLPALFFQCMEGCV